jgi:hypothetical protein
LLHAQKYYYPLSNENIKISFKKQKQKYETYKNKKTSTKSRF